MPAPRQLPQQAFRLRHGLVLLAGRHGQRGGGQAREPFAVQLAAHARRRPRSSARGRRAARPQRPAHRRPPTRDSPGPTRPCALRPPPRRSASTNAGVFSAPSASTTPATDSYSGRRAACSCAKRSRSRASGRSGMVAGALPGHVDVHLHVHDVMCRRARRAPHRSRRPRRRAARSPGPAPRAAPARAPAPRSRNACSPSRSKNDAIGSPKRSSSTLSESASGHPSRCVGEPAEA